METEAKLMYEAFLKSDDLSNFMARPTGNWEKDKKVFMKKYEAHKRLMDDLNINI